VPPTMIRAVSRPNSQVGAQFGYGMSWVMLFSYPLMGRHSGGQRADRPRPPGKGSPPTYAPITPSGCWRAIVGLLLTANVINLGADLGAMGEALQLLVGGSAHPLCRRLRHPLRLARDLLAL